MVNHTKGPFGLICENRKGMGLDKERKWNGNYYFLSCLVQSEKGIILFVISFVTVWFN